MKRMLCMEITTSEEGLHEIPEDEVRAKVEKDFSHFFKCDLYVDDEFIQSLAQWLVLTLWRNHNTALEAFQGDGKMRQPVFFLCLVTKI